MPLVEEQNLSPVVVKELKFVHISSQSIGKVEKLKV